MKGISLFISVKKRVFFFFPILVFLTSFFFIDLAWCHWSLRDFKECIPSVRNVVSVTLPE